MPTGSLTTEAVIELFFLTHRETGGFFLMKRTQTGKILTCFLQCDPGLDNLNNIGSGKKLINKSRRNHRDTNAL